MEALRGDPELLREGAREALVRVEDEIECHVHDPNISISQAAWPLEKAARREYIRKGVCRSVP